MTGSRSEYLALSKAEAEAYTPVSVLIAKKAESKALEDDVEAWLEKNKITELPMGFTHFKDGIIPSVKGRMPGAETESERLEKERKIAEANAAIKAQKEADKARRLAEIKKSKQNMLEKAKKQRLQERLKKKAIADAQRRKAQAERKLEAIRKKTSLKLVTFAPIDPNVLRKRVVGTLRKTALSTGEKSFDAPCQYHGMTRFRLNGNNSAYCTDCHAERNKVAVANNELLELRKKNINARLEALKNGESEFLGYCRHHGHTKYKIYDAQQRGYCLACLDERSLNKEKKEVSPLKLERLAATRQAREQGLKEFVFTCEKHGETIFKLRPTTGADCTACKRERERNRMHGKNPSRMEAFKKREERNRAAIEALKQGETRFTALCEKHGETEFYIGVNGESHRCAKCKYENTLRSAEKNRERYLSHPNTKFLTNLVNSLGRGGQVRVAEYLGVSRSPIHHWLNGRALIHDQHIEKLKKFTGGLAA